MLLPRSKEGLCIKVLMRKTTAFGTKSAIPSAPSSTAACYDVHLSWCYQYWPWLAFWQASYHISG